MRTQTGLSLYWACVDIIVKPLLFHLCWMLASSFPIELSLGSLTFHNTCTLYHLDYVCIVYVYTLFNFLNCTKHNITVYSFLFSKFVKNPHKYFSLLKYLTSIIPVTHSNVLTHKFERELPGNTEEMSHNAMLYGRLMSVTVSKFTTN